MKHVVADPSLVAKCGLYCGACGAYLKERCQGCAGNTKASWCKVRSCCMQRGYGSCADCKDYSDAAECTQFNNFVSRIFGMLFNSDRRSCIGQIREKGIGEHAKMMAEIKRQSLPRKRQITF